MRGVRKAKPTARLGRVIRSDDQAITVQTSQGMLRVFPHATGAASPDRSIQTGDLVSLDETQPRLIAANRSERPLDQQDWWRLLQIAPALRRRAELKREIREYFDSQSFLELEPPTLSQYASLEVHLGSITAAVGGKAHFLQTSPEYHLKRALSGGFERIYSLGRAYRDDESGQHHHAEFSMLEWYRTLESLDALMADVRALVEIAVGQPQEWTTLTVKDALSMFSTPTESPDEIIERLVSDVEPQLRTMGAVFLTEFPRSLASLAAIHPEKPDISLRFEAYVDGIELANGFGELVDALEQRQRFESDQSKRHALGLPVHSIDERFLDALHAGLPPSSGIALGFDRLLMLAVGADHLDDVTLFPPKLA